MTNKIRNVFFTPHILEELVKRGARAASVAHDAVPGDAEMRGAGYAAERGAFYLTFEHESFDALDPGALIPEMRPLFRDDSPRPVDGDAPSFDAWVMWQFKKELGEPCRIWFGPENKRDWIALPAPILSFATGPMGVLFQCADRGVYLLSSDTGDSNDQKAWRVRLLQYV